jgi:OOP family OmpA-OmpF porin
MFGFVFFDSDKATIPTDSLPMLDNFIANLAQLPPCRIAIDGHADTVGSAAHNIALSRRRAEAVAAYFRRHGVRSRIWIRALGETTLFVETPDGVREPRNRRVEFMMVADD